MTFKKFGLAGAIASMLAVPAMAQTLQTSPQQGTTSIPPRSSYSPGMAPAAPRTGYPANGYSGNGAAAYPGSGTRTSAYPGTTTRATASGPVNINTATAKELDALPGIGKARADAIIKNRPYRTPDDLTDRHILPSNVYNKIKGDLVARPG